MAHLMIQAAGHQDHEEGGQPLVHAQTGLAHPEHRGRGHDLRAHLLQHDQVRDDLITVTDTSITSHHTATSRPAAAPAPRNCPVT